MLKLKIDLSKIGCGDGRQMEGIYLLENTTL
jgi:hypothetical protein